LMKNNGKGIIQTATIHLVRASFGVLAFRLNTKVATSRSTPYFASSICKLL
jgi:hypothetical protein